MSACAQISNDAGSIRDVVAEEKTTALNSGAVKDSSAQSLSTLVEVGCAAGQRKDSATAKVGSKDMGRQMRAGTNCPSEDDRHAAAQGSDARGRAAKLGIRKAEQSRERLSATGAVKAAAVSSAMRELDDAPEFEGVQSAYEKGKVILKAYRKAKGAKTPHGAAKKTGSGKAAGAKGPAKKAAGKDMASGMGPAAHTHAANGGAAAQKAATTKTFAATATSALAPLGGILAGIVAFVLGVLVVSQIVSAIFGFWENEANKQSMEGLPPYITYEMVEAALECQEAYGHPAGCTLAQIIAESGQGDHMSQLATRDHNLFGIKWASSFAACSEVSGKSSWQTGEVYDGAVVVITAYFTVFKSDVDCIRFRSRVFLNQPHFANNDSIREAIASHDSDLMAQGLKEGGWATSPVYVDTLKSIMDSYGLRRFDSMTVSEWKDMDAKAKKIIAAAESQLGVPYVWGGSTPGAALDCSGLTQYCYRQAGIAIDHNTETQAEQLRHVPLSEAKPGDILYKPGHVAIFVGGDDYIHEPHSGDVCRRASGIGYFSYALTYRAI